MNKIRRAAYGKAELAMYSALPETQEIDLANVYEISDSAYRANDHIPQESEYEPALHRWSDLQVPIHRHMRSE